jgi:hypothetical protein
MNSYLYPTVPGWFESLLKSWKASGKRTFAFPFLWFKPTTLPTNQSAPFWMYLYYTENQTKDPSWQRVVEFRVRVVFYDFFIIQGTHIHTCREQESDAKVWFQCDLVEEIKDVNGGHLHESDFKHSEGVALLQSVRNSIAPVDRVSSMVTVQSTWHYIND